MMLSDVCLSVAYIGPNVLAVGNCCYVAVCSVAQGASVPTGEERGGGISWRPPAYSLLLLRKVVVKAVAINLTVRRYGWQ